ncbi:hypothetical protein CDL15_Pgr004628 [Punica granatum]|uniref:Neprosin PEP catalytic domain-containing protein n=1 Tax=Punica granatum TaxID=22663 RepID=A0A218WRK7_PUNGR|nr:hypothetical protein CDL15_Pgr004628 [Punica granatum]
MRECLGSQFAVVKIGSGKQTPFAAGQSSINIQQPDLKAGETSGAQIWLDGGDGGSSNLVSAGGSYVDPTLYGDSRVYFTAHWKDENTKNWWIAGGDNLTPIGYWPKELFSSLTEGATSLAYGGILLPMVREFIALSGEAGVVEQIFWFICKVAGMMLEQGWSTSPLVMCIHAFCGFIAFGFELHRNGCFVTWILMIVIISALALIA